MSYNHLSSQLLLDWFPELNNNIVNEMLLSGEMPNCLYADVLNPIIIDFFQNDVTENEKLVIKIFDFIEFLAENGDDSVKNLIQVSLLERLWDTSKVYEHSIMFMRSNTKLINNNISSYLEKP